MKNIILSALLLLVFMVAGALVTYLIMNNQKSDEVVRTDAVVIMDRIEKVCKLVTVEGNYSETYDETNFRELTLYVPLPSKFTFSKKAQLQVTGKVLVGYDLTDIEIEVDSLDGTLIVKNIPEPDVIAVDHSLAYKDISESWFNSFGPQDYTQINQNAKKVILDKAHTEMLLDEAKLEGNQVLEAMRMIAEQSGWQLRIDSTHRVPLLD